MSTILAPNTIFALCTPAGKSGIAVFRISGPRAGAALTALTGKPLPAPRHAVLRRFRCQIAGKSIHLDDGLALWFPAPASFTGEDVAELHLHGGPSVIAAMAEALASLGLDPAEPGQFTRRAFDSGKLDLVEIEGFADLIAAETEGQRRQALRQFEGELSALYERWRGLLIGVQARIEAAIDFPDEDLPATLGAELDRALQTLKTEIAAHLKDNRRGEMLRSGLSIAIIGAPNVGKSSLLNRLAGREAAIVSARAGTTRDVIELRLDLGGYPLLLADTAGLRESGDEIEIEGMRRALARAESADLKLIVLDAARWPEIDQESLAHIDANALVILNKADLAASTLPAKAALPVQVKERPALAVSAKTGAGIAELLNWLGDWAEKRLSGGDQPALTRLRHRLALEKCLDCLEKSTQAAQPELMAEEIRAAAQALARITGRMGVEDLLDAIFREFCIGK
jgi:tRNA modification GTPase